MKKIGITTPNLWAGEASAICSLLDQTLDFVHIRKPSATCMEVEALIRLIPQEYHARLVLHNHHELSNQFAFKALHLNHSYPTPPSQYTGALTRSCHSLHELVDLSPYTYVFLSPIYNSISKQGYKAAFTTAQLEEAFRQGLINQKVIALGGVTPSHFTQLQSYGFGGAAMMGYLWTSNTIQGK
ncbi:MAG: thiamine phosphate synthase [Bacteroidales bacterium]